MLRSIFHVVGRFPLRTGSDVILIQSFVLTFFFVVFFGLLIYTYRGADKSSARPGRKQATATESLDVHISYLLLLS